MFKDVKGYEGYYQINKHGVVKSVERKVSGCTFKEKILKQDLSNSGGYARVTLSKEGKTKRFLLHRLVYENFIGEIPKHLTIHHIDEDKLNNHIDNLVACTHKQNNHFSAVAKGYKLTQKDVNYIRTNNLTTREISDKYGISLRHALRIIKNERWM
jgi:hypothetical protein